MKKMIIINYAPLTKSLEKFYYLDYLSENGIEVEYWDITKLYFSTINLTDVIERPYVIKFADFQKLKSRLQQESKTHTLFILQITYDGTVIKLYRLFTKSKCELGFFERPALPIPVAKTITKSTRIKNLLNQLVKTRAILKLSVVKQLIFSYVKIAQNLILYYKSKLYKKLKIIKEYDVVFAAGKQSINRYQMKSKIIYVNHFDYDNFLQAKNNFERLVPGKYCVFIDDFLAYHPDFQMSKIETIESKTYFQSLNQFFKRIEDKYQISVVIAAHPKSDYTPHEFENRLCIKYKTNELVKNCEFAIGHYSTAISYAVLYQKPIFFIFTNGMAQVFRETYLPFMKNFSAVLDGQLINIDQIKNGNDIQLKSVNLKKYQQYQNNYLSSKESEGRLTKNILLEYFKN